MTGATTALPRVLSIPQPHGTRMVLPAAVALVVPGAVPGAVGVEIVPGTGCIRVCVAGGGGEECATTDETAGNPPCARC